MKRRIFGVVIGLILALSMVLSACGGEATPTATTPTATAPAPTATAPAPTATAPAPTATAPTPAATQAHWWDSLGEPKYGGTITHVTGDITTIDIDPYLPGFQGKQRFWWDTLFQPDWAVDRSVWPFSAMWCPIDYQTGCLAESWEQTDPTSITLHIHQGIHWQDKPPVNGREFTADDVKYNFDRMLGIGSGFDQPSPVYGPNFSNIIQVAATDKYTTVLKYKQPSALLLDLFMNQGFQIVPPEWVQQGDLKDWHKVVGTGPWIVTDYSVGTSMTFIRNPNYFGYDERYPKNQLPYADGFKEVQISDMSTALAAMRTGKVDIIADMQGPALSQSISLAKNSPEIKQAYNPMAGMTLMLKWNTKPFDDIRVRQALNMAIDRPTIAKSHYSGLVDGKPAGLMHPLLKGWVTPYDEWPKELQEGYSYNPNKAKTLLAEAGYPNGFKTSCLTAADRDMELLQIIKSYFMDIGVDMTIDAHDFPTFIGLALSGKLETTFNPQCGNSSGPLQNVASRAPGVMMNHGFVDDPAFNAIYEKLKVATTIEEAQQLTKEADMYALEHYFDVQVCPVVSPVVWQPWLKGYSGEYIAGLFQCQFYARMWIDQDLKKSMGH